MNNKLHKIFAAATLGLGLVAFILQLLLEYNTVGIDGLAVKITVCLIAIVINSLVISGARDQFVSYEFVSILGYCILASSTEYWYLYLMPLTFGIITYLTKRKSNKEDKKDRIVSPELN